MPIICNLTSDLNAYLKNDYNSLILNNDDPKEFTRCVLSALDKKEDELELMRKNSRLTSEKQLDISLYSNELLKAI